MDRHGDPRPIDSDSDEVCAATFCGCEIVTQGFTKNDEEEEEDGDKEFVDDMEEGEEPVNRSDVSVFVFAYLSPVTDVERICVYSTRATMTRPASQEDLTKKRMGLGHMLTTEAPATRRKIPSQDLFRGTRILLALPFQSTMATK